MRLQARFPSSSLALAASLLSVASGAGSSARNSECPEDGSICLTSFKWCDANGESCSYPKGADAFATGMEYAVLYHGFEYEILWTQASEDFPVLIEWLFPPFYFPLSDQSKSSQTLEVMWSTNVTGSSFMFDPEKIAAEFPTEHAPKMTPAEATVATQNNGNIIRISQPGRESWPANEQDSQHFFVQTSWVAAQVEHAREWHAEQREQSEKKWKLGVGISVGLGIPVIVAVTFLLAKRGSVATLSGKSLPK